MWSLMTKIFFSHEILWNNVDIKLTDAKTAVMMLSYILGICFRWSLAMNSSG